MTFIGTFLSSFVFITMSKADEYIIGDKRIDEAVAWNLKRHVRVLSEEIGERNFVRYQNLERAADYINAEFKKYGYEPEEQVYHLGGVPYRNIIATKKGTLQPDKIVIVCAHYDSVVGSPGADDNASGVAGLLEVARLLHKVQLKKTIKFIAFTNEEPPFFMSDDMGSFQYAREARDKRDDILGVLCLESIGYYSDKKGSQSHPVGLNLFYPDEGNFIGVASDLRSRHLLKKIVEEFKRGSNFPIESLVGISLLVPAITFSDHWSFWRFGYRAVMVTDTAFYRYNYYHTVEDTLEKLDYQSLAEVVNGLYNAIARLSSL